MLKKGEVSVGDLCWIQQGQGQQGDSERGGSAKAKDSENDLVKLSEWSRASQHNTAAHDFDFLSCVLDGEKLNKKRFFYFHMWHLIQLVQ